jgi:hypothetical protein
MPLLKAEIGNNLRDFGFCFSLFHLPRPVFFIMLVAVRLPRTGIDLGLPTATIMVTGIPLAFLGILELVILGDLLYIMLFPF